MNPYKQDEPVSRHLFPSIVSEIVSEYTSNVDIIERELNRAFDFNVKFNKVTGVFEDEKLLTRPSLLTWCREFKSKDSLPTGPGNYPWRVIGTPCETKSSSSCSGGIQLHPSRKSIIDPRVIDPKHDNLTFTIWSLGKEGDETCEVVRYIVTATYRVEHTGPGFLSSVWPWHTHTLETTLDSVHLEVYIRQ